MQKLPVRQRLLLGFTLFSMFFGAGNLIFPPHLGAQAGSNFWPAFAGFAVSAIGLPIAGVVAVARAGGFDHLASRVHPKFSLVFTILVYLSIGPCLAIPRTASTSFEMLVPLVGGGRGLQLSYSIVFFAAAFLVALHPEKLTDRLGRVLCPALIALIFVLFAGCLLHPVAAQYGSPAAAYARLPAFEGILGGYQTMDALAGLYFGAVLALNIQALGVTEENAIRQNAFREDLYYRLNVFTLNVPPLRERSSDIALLINHFLDHFVASLGRGPLRVTDRAMDVLLGYPWPGNIRELENVMERLANIVRHPLVSEEDLPPQMVTVRQPASPQGLLHSKEAETILETLRQTGGNIRAAAALLGVSRGGLYVKLRRLGIDVESCRGGEG